MPDFEAGPRVVEGGLLWSGTRGFSLTTAGRSRLIVPFDELAASSLSMSSVLVEDGWTVVAASSLRAGRTGAPLAFIDGLLHCAPGPRAGWLAATAEGDLYTIVHAACVGRSPGGAQLLVRIRLGTGSVQAIGPVPREATALAAAGHLVALAYAPPGGSVRVDVVRASDARPLYSLSEPARGRAAQPLLPPSRAEEPQIDAAGDVVVSGGYDQPLPGGRPIEGSSAWWGDAHSHGAHSLGEIGSVALSDGLIAYEDSAGTGIRVRDLATGTTRTVVAFPGSARPGGVGLRGKRLAWAQQNWAFSTSRLGACWEHSADGPFELAEGTLSPAAGPIVVEGPVVPTPAGPECVAAI